MNTVPLIAANWKMNKLPSEAERWAQSLVNRLDVGRHRSEVAILPPYTHLAGLRGLLGGTPVLLGAQDVSAHESGAYTGEVSAAMLRDLDARYVIVGHSERRQYHGEDDALINQKVSAAIGHGLIPILCIGEKLAERQAGRAESVVLSQLEADLSDIALTSSDQLVVAYEPVWAIGTGRTATAPDAQAMSSAVRSALARLYPFGASIRILYGGSIKPENAAELFGQADVDGGLVGGASLEIDSLLSLVEAAHG